MIKVLEVHKRSLVRIYNKGGRICFLKNAVCNLKLSVNDHIRIGFDEDTQNLYLCKHSEGVPLLGNGNSYCFANCQNLFNLTGMKINYMNEYELIRYPEGDKVMEGECYELKLKKTFNSPSKSSPTIQSI